jgi:hypothetical protein
MFDGARQQAFQRFNNQFGVPGQQGFGQPGFGQPGGGQPGGGQPGAPLQNWNTRNDDDYDHYNVEGSDPALRRNRGSRRSSGDYDASLGDNPIEDIGGAIFGAALGFAGRAIGRRMKQAFEEKVVPAVQARAAQAQQQFEQSKGEEEAIVERYPELRGCLKDKVVFLDGGHRTVPISELRLPITLAQADTVVARLR